MNALITLAGVVIALLLGFWLAFSAVGLILNILGYVLIVAAVVWLVRELQNRGRGGV